MKIPAGFLIVLYMATGFLTTPTIAAEQPVQVSLFTPVQIFPENDTIKGDRLNLIYGRNTSLTGLDIGLVNHLTGGKSTGVQWGLVGLNDGDFTGWQDCAVNYNKGRFEGLQFGFVNLADHLNGIQIGLVNYAVTAKGLQIGVINFIDRGGQFPIFPIVNWSF